MRTGLLSKREGVGSFHPRVRRLRNGMDRLDAMKVFVVAVDEGSLAAAGRKLGRSPAAVSRAIAFLEQRAGSKLLYRTTRSIKLSEEGERYVASCRRVLTELEEAETIISGERSVPRGTLSLTAATFSGETVLLPIVKAFLDAYPTVSVRLLFVDRPVDLIDEGVDVALRIGHLADSSMVATRIGEVRSVVVAAPSYLRRHPSIEEPSDLAKHQIIAMAHIPSSWTFPPASSSSAPRTVQFAPRLIVNSVRAALVSALGGCGAARVLSYHVAEHVGRGELEIVLADNKRSLPVHLLSPHGRLSVPRVRAFMDFATPRLKSYFAGLAKDLTDRRSPTRS
jgi:DNA-binding transcriptional LysR family regulator